MSNFRKARINDEFMRTVADALRTVKDPRVSSHMITVTQCDVSGDLKYAKIYFSLLDSDDEAVKEVKQGLKSARGLIRHEIAAKLNMRITPELTFIYDNAIERGANIFRLLKETHIDDPASDTDSEGGDGE